MHACRYLILVIVWVIRPFSVEIGNMLSVQSLIILMTVDRLYLLKQILNFILYNSNELHTNNVFIKTFIKRLT